MYKVLIVDDDIMIRNGIKDAIPWSELEVEEVATAKSGVEGEELFKTMLPDLVLTDIRMSRMDGLELLKRIREIKQDVKVIILSGYDDFSYAQTAIKLGAFDYLLKTEGIDQLMSVMRRAFEEIKEENKKRDFYLRIRQQLNISLPLLRNRYLNELLFGFTSTERLIKQLEFVEVNFRSELFALAVAEIDDLLSSDQDQGEEERLLIKFSVMNIMEEMLGDRGLCFESKYEEFVIIFYFDPELSNSQNKANLTTFCEELCNSIRTHLNISLSVGISNMGTGLSRVRSCYEDAKKALGHKLFLGKGIIIDVEDVEGCETDSFFMEIEDERSIISSLRVGDRKQLFATLDHLFLKLGERRSIKNDDFYRVCIEMLSLASRVLCEYCIDLKSVLGREVVYFEEIKKYKTFSEAKQWVFSVFEAVVRSILNTKIIKAKKVVELAKKYINEHFTEPLTLEKVAEVVFVSPSYLSRLFSNEVGMGFMEYVTQLRLEKAKQLLGEKDAKVFEVGEKVGYDNPQYFSRIFKKYTGISPTEYKDGLKE